MNLNAVIAWARARPPLSWVWKQKGAAVLHPLVQAQMDAVQYPPTLLPDLSQVARSVELEPPPWRDTAVAEAPEAPKAKRAARPAAAPSGDPTGEFYFKETILDQLEHYFLILRRMRKGDPSAYALYRQIGIHIVPLDMVLHGTLKKNGTAGALNSIKVVPINEWWLKTRPSFGAVAYAMDPRLRATENQISGERPNGWMVPRFMYFSKFKPSHAPITMQQVSGGDVYCMTVYWDKPGVEWMKHSGEPSEYGVLVKEDGSLQLLLTLQREEVKVRLKRKAPWEGPHIYIPQTRWALDPFFVFWAKEHDADPVAYLLAIFSEAVNCYSAAATRRIRVDCGWHEMHAVFSVDVKRTPYFFKDRDITVNHNGRRRRIFHIVREHLRMVTNAVTGVREVTVREHFRGEREFLWNKYRVHITVPGLHHTDIATMDVPAVSVDAVPPEVAAKAWSQEHLGRVLREVVAERPEAVKRLIRMKPSREELDAGLR